MTSISMIAFFGMLVILIWVYLGYPLLLAFVSFFKKRKVAMMNTYTDFPSVSFIIAAYNEEKVIGDKIKNTMRLDYPRDKLEIIVFSDASSDKTDEIVKSYEPQGVKLVRIEGRKGKVFCKNKVAKKATGEILVFSDANTMYEPDAIKHLVRWFSDPTVGCVAGELRYKHEGAVAGEGLYWKYEQWIKRMEGRLGNLTTANGAIYALKKDCFEPLPLDVPDDFGTTLLIKAKGLKVVHEPEAVAWEETAPNVLGELRRRVRMVSGASYCLFKKSQFRILLNPFKYGFFAIQLWSHKVLRWFTGVFLSLAFLSNFFLYKESFCFAITFWMQVSFYTLGIWGIIQELWLGKKAPKFIHIISYFVLSCYSMLRGLWKGIRGKAYVTWTPIR